jgi:branched-chain amino acid transport system substrate-binding protein
MPHLALLRAAFAALVLLVPAAGRAADPSTSSGPLKVGVIFSYTGATAVAGRVFDAAVALYMREHGDTVAGRKVELIKRDDTGIAPDTARRLAQELIVNDKVDLLAGIVFTPNAIAVAGVSTAAHKPLFIVNAATSNIIAKHPYAVRFGFTTAQTTVPFGQWAAKNGIKTAYVVYQDYGPGVDAAKAFSEGFTGSGGRVVGEVAMPLNTTDFTAYMQRVKDARPDAMYVFINATGAGQSLLKACKDAGFTQAGIKILAEGSLVTENNLNAVGDLADGIVTSADYTAWHPSRANAAFVRGFQSIEPTLMTDFTAVAAYDVMHAIYAVVAAQNGNVDPDRTVELAKHLKFESPRGPIAIDPDTRDIVLNVYIRRTEKKNGKLVNTEIVTIPMVKDPYEKP